MLKNSILALSMLVVLTLTSTVYAQKFSGLDKSPADIAYFRVERNSPPLIKVIYSRPSLKGRGLGTDLAPFGEVWRTGANETTEIKFYTDVYLGDTKVPAGTYSLFSVPGKSEWTIIINSDIDTWGAYAYKEENDVARLTVPSTTDSKSLEEFSIVFGPGDKGANLVMGWGKTRVSVPIMIAE